MRRADEVAGDGELDAVVSDSLADVRVWRTQEVAWLDADVCSVQHVSVRTLVDKGAVIKRNDII